MQKPNQTLLIRHEKKSSSNDGHPLWLATLGDLMTNILTFFVMIVALNSSSTTKEYIEKINTIRSSFGGNYLSSAEEEHIYGRNTAAKPEEMDWKSADTLAHLNAIMNTLRLGNKGGIYNKGGNICISFPPNVVFTSTWVFDRKATKFFKEIERLMEMGEFPVKIEAYWDDSPIPNGQSTSVFTAELAGKILRFFMNNGKIPASRFSMAGYGNTRSYNVKNPFGKPLHEKKIVILFSNPDFKPANVPQYKIFGIG